MSRKRQSSTLDQPLVTVAIRAGDRGSEILVVDSQFHTIARGIGSLKARLAPGFYKARFKAGNRIEDRLFEATGSKVGVQGQALAFSSPIPLRGTSSNNEYQRRAARKIARAAPVSQIGAGAELLVFVRDSQYRKDSAPRAPAPWSDIRVIGSGGEDLFELDSADHVHATEGYAGAKLSLDPGQYFIESRNRSLGTQVISLPVVTCSGWCTHVYIDSREGRADSPDVTLYPRDETVYRIPDFAGAAVEMARIGSNGADLSESRARPSEIARQALMLGQYSVSDRELRMISGGRYQQPMLALYAASFLLSEPGADLTRIGPILVSLQAWLESEHPDVSTLLALCVEKTGKSEWNPAARRLWPPLLATTWRLAEVGQMPLPVDARTLSASRQYRSGGTVWNCLQFPRHIDRPYIPAKDSLLEGSIARSAVGAAVGAVLLPFPSAFGAGVAIRDYRRNSLRREALQVLTESKERIAGFLEKPNPRQSPFQQAIWRLLRDSVNADADEPVDIEASVQELIQQFHIPVDVATEELRQLAVEVMDRDRVGVPGSRRAEVTGARRVGPARPDDPLAVTIRLRGKASLPQALLAKFQQPPRLRDYPTLEELGVQWGADLGQVAQVEAFARRNGLAVVDHGAAHRSMTVEGTVEAMGRAFGVHLEQWERAGQRYRGRRGLVHVPSHLDGIVTGVFGLDDRRFGKGHVRHFNRLSADSFVGYSPTEMAALYNFPSSDGSGQVIGIIDLGAADYPDDLTPYFKERGVPARKVTAVCAHQKSRQPTAAASVDSEVFRCVEMIASLAPGAAIVVYHTAGVTDQDFINALTAAVYDGSRSPSVLCISWGGPEGTATHGFLAAVDEVLTHAAILGITVIAASGNDGAADMGPEEWDQRLHTDFPASSPYVLSCGATRVEMSRGLVFSESVWKQGTADLKRNTYGASGGGVSEIFALPSYQGRVSNHNSTAAFALRGVPDVSAHGDPELGYALRVNKPEVLSGGTGLAASLWAGLMARVNGTLNQRVGCINPLLYAHSSIFRDVTAGNNVVGDPPLGYFAGPGWDACTGLGTPDGMRLLSVLSGLED